MLATALRAIAPAGLGRSVGPVLLAASFLLALSGCRAEDLPTAPAPGLPDVPQTPDIPDIPDIPDSMVRQSEALSWEGAEPAFARPQVWTWRLIAIQPPDS